ncbi:MAG: leucine-rich repeat domain-containing protein [Bacteroidota bacterium]
MRLLILLYIIILGGPVFAQQRTFNRDSMQQVMEERRKLRKIYLTNLEKYPKKTLDSVRHAQMEINSERGLLRLQELKSNTRLDTLKRMDLSYAGLNKIPDFVFDATNIEFLILSYNHIKKLPKELSRLKKLKYISWSNNGLDDFWWISIKDLDQLESLNLSDNTLTRVPLGIGKLDGLKTLILDHNLFEEFPVRRLSRNENIRKVTMNRCSWMQIGEGPFEKLDFIKELYLNSCNLTSLDPSFYQMRGISELQMQGNKLRGLPDGISSMENLTKVSFYGNELATLPNDLFDLKKLLAIDLYYNQLKVIPYELGNLSNLEVLYLAHNELYDIPPSIGQLNNLEELYLHHNKFSVLPEEISKLKNLKVVRVNDNFLMEFPDQILKLDLLKDIDVSNNQISTIPTDISELERLKLFTYNGNEIDFESHKNQNLVAVLYKMIERGVICVPKVDMIRTQ